MLRLAPRCVVVYPQCRHSAPMTGSWTRSNAVAPQTLADIRAICDTPKLVRFCLPIDNSGWDSRAGAHHTFRQVHINALPMQIQRDDVKPVPLHYTSSCMLVH